MAADPELGTNDRSQGFPALWSGTSEAQQTGRSIPGDPQNRVRLGAHPYGADPMNPTQ